MFPSRERGGAEEVVLRLTQFLGARGWEVQVGFPDNPGTQSLRRDLVAAGASCRVLNVGQWAAEGRFEALLAAGADLARTLWFLLVTRAGRRLVSMPYPGATLGGMLGTALAPGRTLVHFHVASPGWRPTSLWRRVARLSRARTQWSAISAPLAHDLAATFDCPVTEIEVVVNGVDVTAIKDATDSLRRDGTADALRLELGIAKEAVVAVSIARLSPQKGHEFLVQVAAGLTESHPDLVHVWVGDGPVREAIGGQVARLGLEDRVRLLGSQADVRPFLAIADVFVSASRWEGGTPLAVMEALAAGLPVVATRASAVAPVVPGVHAAVVATDDVGALGEAVAWLVDDPEAAARLGRAGQVLASEDYDVSSSFSSLMRLLAHDPPVPVA